MIPIDISVEIWYNKCGQKIVHIVSTKAQMKQKTYTFQKIWEGFFDTPARETRVTDEGIKVCRNDKLKKYFWFIKGDRVNE